METLAEVITLFQEALACLDRKDEVTGKATYNRAQDMLDEIMKDMISPDGAAVRQARKQIRLHLQKVKPLRKIFEASLAFWTQVSER